MWNVYVLLLLCNSWKKNWTRAGVGQATCLEPPTAFLQREPRADRRRAEQSQGVADAVPKTQETGEQLQPRPAFHVHGRVRRPSSHGTLSLHQSGSPFAEILISWDEMIIPLAETGFGHNFIRHNEIGFRLWEISKELILNKIICLAEMVNKSIAGLWCFLAILNAMFVIHRRLKIVEMWEYYESHFCTS